MSGDDEFLRQAQLRRQMAESQAREEDSSDDGLIPVRHKGVPRDQAQVSAPANDDALVSENTKEAFKKAGAIAAVATKWSAGKAKEGMSIAAEKAQIARLAAENALALREAKRGEAIRAAVAAKADQAVSESAPQPAEGGLWVKDGMGSLSQLLDLGRSVGEGSDVAPFQGLDGEGIAKALYRAPKKRRTPLWMGLALVLGAAGGGAYWWSQRKQEPVVPAPKVIAAPVAKPLPRVIPSVPQVVPQAVPVPEPVPEVQPQAIEPAPGPVRVDPVEPKAEKPVQADPVPVATPAAKPRPKPKAAPVEAKAIPPAKPAVKEKDWADKAQDDMSAFEKELGIE